MGTHEPKYVSMVSDAQAEVLETLTKYTNNNFIESFSTQHVGGGRVYYYTAYNKQADQITVLDDESIESGDVVEFIGRLKELGEIDEHPQKMGPQHKIKFRLHRILNVVVLEILEQRDLVTADEQESLEYFCNETQMYVRSYDDIGLSSTAINILGYTGTEPKATSIEFRTEEEAIRYEQDVIKTMSYWAGNQYFNPTPYKRYMLKREDGSYEI